jgi:hypothetical protein
MKDELILSSCQNQRQPTSKTQNSHSSQNYNGCVVLIFLLPSCIQNAEKRKFVELKKTDEVMKEAYEEEIEKKNKELKDVCASLDDIAGEKLGKEININTFYMELWV